MNIGLASLKIGGTFSRGYHRYTLTERTADSSLYLVTPDFTPRKVDPAKVETSKGLDTLDTLERNKEVLQKKLNNGRGNLSLQEWDDFLADLEEMAVITHDERMYANGITHEIPDDAIHGTYTFSSDVNPNEEWDLLWDGNPLQWLERVDLYMLKYELYAHMEGKIANRSAQRAAYIKLIDIIKEICS